MFDEQVSADSLLEQFLQTLQELPEVDANNSLLAKSGSPDQDYDASIEVTVGKRSVTLMIEARANLYPRDVRQLIWRIRESARNRTQPAKKRAAVLVLLAPAISSGAKELLRNERIGYYDSGGSIFLCAQNIYVYVDKPLPKFLSKSIQSLFSNRRAQVLHLLLMRHNEWFGVKEIANLARVSPATASQVLKELERYDWAVSRGQGPAKERNLNSPGALLDAWAKQLEVMQPLAMDRYFIPLVPKEDLVRKFSDACASERVEYSITHQAAGQRYAPFLTAVTQVRCRMLNSAAADRVLRVLNAELVNMGANFAVIETKSSSELHFKSLVDGIWLASPIQVYLDLIRSEGRSKELAHHLRREVLGF